MELFFVFFRTRRTNSYNQELGYQVKMVSTKFLSTHNIISCGRYGSWRYLSMEDVITESKEIARGVSRDA